jgi:hypothetical protein
MRRRDFLVGGGQWAAGSAVAGALLFGRPAPALAQPDDRDLLERALAVERRLAALYSRADFDQARLFGEQCREHVSGLELALRNRGGRPRTGPDPAPAENGRAAALRLETDAVAACFRATGGVRDGRLLPAFAAIMANHGQHLVVLREALGRDPLPNPLETGGVQLA